MSSLVNPLEGSEISKDRNNDPSLVVDPVETATPELLTAEIKTIGLIFSNNLPDPFAWVVDARFPDPS